MQEEFQIAGAHMIVYHRRCGADHLNCWLEIVNARFTDEHLPQLAAIFAGPPNLRFSKTDLRDCTFSNGVAEFLQRVETKNLAMVRCGYPGIIATEELALSQCHFETVMDCVTDSPTVPIVEISSMRISPEEINEVFGVIGRTVVHLTLQNCTWGDGDLARVFATASFPALDKLYLSDPDLDETVLFGLIAAFPRAPRLKEVVINCVWRDSAYRALAAAVENHIVPLHVFFYTQRGVNENIQAMFDEAYQTAVAAKEVRVKSLVAGLVATNALPSKVEGGWGDVRARTDDFAVQVSGHQTVGQILLKFLKPSGTM